ncbi:MAG TPA: hypothetical protein VJ953_21935 [Saprospiraceae bacterium]|nr:hypothetical protein [Saprospiraceae bacterium]
MEYLAFAEGQLTFHFDPAYWQVRKYDDHAYFQGFSGVGLKGVDFIGIYQEDILVLLEVKNYTWRYTPFREKDVRQSLRGPELIAAAVQQKMEDTLAGLRAIRIYYERKQARSWRWLDRFRKTDIEQLFWQRATSLLEQGKIQCLLWLETEAEDAAFAEKIAGNLAKTPVRGGLLVQVVHRGNYPFSGSWQVEKRD